MPSEIFFPDFNKALPEPNAGQPPQGSPILNSAFSGILSAANDIATEYENLQITRNVAENTAKNLEKLKLFAEADQVRSQGATATLNPFNPEENSKLRNQFTELFNSSSESLRQRTTQLEVQAARNSGALARTIEAGGQSRKTQQEGFNQDLVENVQTFGQRTALQASAGQIAVEKREDEQDQQNARDGSQFDDALTLLGEKQAGDARLQDARLNNTVASGSSEAMQFLGNIVGGADILNPFITEDFDSPTNKRFLELVGQEFSGNERNELFSLKNQIIKLEDDQNTVASGSVEETTLAGKIAEKYRELDDALKGLAKRAAIRAGNARAAGGNQAPPITVPPSNGPTSPSIDAAFSTVPQN